MEFRVVHTGELSQTAIMTLEPGEVSGPKENEHAHSEQTLYVSDGELHAEIGDRSFTMRAGDSTIVPRNEAHKFTNRSQRRAVTFNVYAPPAY